MSLTKELKDKFCILQSKPNHEKQPKTIHPVHKRNFLKKFPVRSFSNKQGFLKKLDFQCFFRPKKNLWRKDDTKRKIFISENGISD